MRDKPIRNIHFSTLYFALISPTLAVYVLPSAPPCTVVQTIINNCLYILLTQLRACVCVSLKGQWLSRHRQPWKWGKTDRLHLEPRPNDHHHPLRTLAERYVPSWCGCWCYIRQDLKIKARRKHECIYLLVGRKKMRPWFTRGKMCG